MEKELNFKDLAKKVLKKEGWSSVVFAILFLLLGILIVNHPETIVATVSYILGGFLVLVGLAQTIAYFAEKGNWDFENYDVVSGILTIVVGLVFILHVTLLETIFNFIIGLWLIYEGMIRITSAMKLKKYNVKVWWIVLVSAILMGIAGVYVLVVPNVLVTVLGAIMIVYAVLDIVDGIIFVMNVNKL